MKRLSIITIFTSLFLLFGSSAAEKQSYLESIEGLDPMDLSEVNPKVAGILRKYYQFTFGDSLAWDSIESLRVEGEIQLQEQTLKFVAYKKKPNYLKMVIYLDNGGRLTFSYDGEDAWQFNDQEPNAEPVSMPEGEALNFIRDATTGGHLLYPQMKGKQFEFVGTALVQGDRVYELKTTLPDGQVIRSYFDMTSFAELYQVTISNVNQAEELNVHTDFRRIGGMRIPFLTTLIEDGEQVLRSRISKIQTNNGSMPWVFTRSSVESSWNKGTKSEVSNFNHEKSLNGKESVEAAEGSAFTTQGSGIWSTTDGGGSVFQIEPDSASQEQLNRFLNSLKQEADETENSEALVVE